MTKISNTGPKPIPESVPETNKKNEATQATTASQLTPERQVVADKYVAGDLKAAGDQIKSQLESQLQSKTTGVKQDPSLSPEQLAELAARGQVRFAPPYVPVGPVVMGDNIPTPASNETTEMSLSPDQFQINEQGNLVITNDKLIEYFKSLKETGQDILLNVKPRSEE